MLAKIKSDNEALIFTEYFNKMSIGKPNLWTGLKLYENYTTAEQYGEWADGSVFYFRNDGIDQKNERYMITFTRFYLPEFSRPIGHVYRCREPYLI